jgi:MFS family permease
VSHCGGRQATRVYQVRNPAAAPDRPHQNRRAVALLCIAFAFEASIYAAVPPLLPHYAHSAGLSSALAGLLVASYTTAVIPGTLAASALARTQGPRTVLLASLVLFAASTEGFAFAHTAPQLLSTRAFQGAAAGGLWSPGLRWLMALVTGRDRGRALGLAFGAAAFGTIGGPLLAALVLGTGGRFVFSLAALTAGGLAAALATNPPPSADVSNTARLVPPRLSGALCLPGSLILMQSIPFGIINAVIPLRIVMLAGTQLTVTVVFAIAALLSTAVAPLAGHISDLRGRLLPMFVALLIAPWCLMAMPIVRNVPSLGALTVLYLAPLYNFAFVPATALAGDAPARGIPELHATRTIMLAIALGESIGSACGGVLTERIGVPAPFVLSALVTLLAVALLASRPSSLPCLPCLPCLSIPDDTPHHRGRTEPSPRLRIRRIRRCRHDCSWTGCGSFPTPRLGGASS